MDRRSSTVRCLALCSLAALPPSALAGQLLFDMHAGHRTDRLQWGIADPVNDIDILSELSWRNLRMAAVGADLRYQASTPLVLLARADYGYATSGSVQDSDYWQSGRNREFSRSTGSARGSQAFGFSAGIGLPLGKELGDWQVQLMPMLGLAAQYQKLRFRDGNQVYVYPGSQTPLGPIDGLNTRYDARWNGVWGGLELELQNRKDLTMRVRLEQHASDYSAKANWNLRTDFAHPVSFRQWASAQGRTITAEARYAYANAYIMAQLSHSAWKAGRGKDEIYLDIGETRYTPFNGARWESSRLSLGLGFDF
jgi:outer membrane protease